MQATPLVDTSEGLSKSKPRWVATNVSTSSVV